MEDTHVFIDSMAREQQHKKTQIAAVKLARHSIRKLNKESNGGIMDSEVVYSIMADLIKDIQNLPQ